MDKSQKKKNSVYLVCYFESDGTYSIVKKKNCVKVDEEKKTLQACHEGVLYDGIILDHSKFYSFILNNLQTKTKCFFTKVMTEKRQNS
jgi:hypothetical protein